MNHKALCDLAFFPSHAPARGGLLRQHRAGGGGGFAAGQFIGFNRGASGGGVEPLRPGKSLRHQGVGAGRQPGGNGIPQRDPFLRQRNVGVGTRNRRRLHGNLPPVRAQFMRHDLR